MEAPERGRRRSLRRAVAIDCGLRSSLWDGELILPASDVSVSGMWIETPIVLAPGEELIVSFTPPSCAEHERVWAAARVVRVGRARRHPRDPAPRGGMGVSFTYCSDSHLRLLARALYGRPPRLPPVKQLPPPLPVP